MGFIDYQGTKENRYDDVLEYAKSQQEEEARRIENERIRKCLEKILGDGRYASLEITELLKYLIVRYRKLSELRDGILKEEENIPVDNNMLWKDFCVALVTRRIEAFKVDEKKRNAYIHSVLGKIFKLDDFTEVERYYACLRDNAKYKRYFSDCFDLVQEKQFWKWLGHNSTDKTLLREFVKCYEQVSVLLGYYFFQGIYSNDFEWLKRLDLEHQILEKISYEFENGRLREPNITKLLNPLYEPRKVMNEVNIEIQQEVSQGVLEEDIEAVKTPKLDRNVFEKLLDKKNLMDYANACKMLVKCDLPEKMTFYFNELTRRLPVLQESVIKFEEVYQPDLYQFFEYYIPEALRLTATYIEYLDVGIGEKILKETEMEVLDAASKLLLAINDKIDEIYKFASIELKAKAKALESIMSLDGHVNPDYKIN